MTHDMPVTHGILVPKFFVYKYLKNHPFLMVLKGNYILSSKKTEFRKVRFDDTFNFFQCHSKQRCVKNVIFRWTDPYIKEISYLISIKISHIFWWMNLPICTVTLNPGFQFTQERKHRFFSRKALKQIHIWHWHYSCWYFTCFSTII